MKDNIILLGSDHLGLSLKNSLKNHLQDKGYKVEDVGVDNEETSIDGLDESVA